MEGTIPFTIEGIDEPCYTWYKVYGDLKATSDNIKPLVLYPGGPGACHEYLLPLVDLYEKHGIPLIFFDPVGNGRSTSLAQKADDVSFWTPELFEKELLNLVDYLGLEKCGFDFFGQSWGGMLGSKYAASHPKGLRKLVLASSPSSVKLLNEHDKFLLSQFPQEVQEAFEEAEKEGHLDSDEYQQAAMEFYKKHLCRAYPWPSELEATLGHLEGSTAYRHMYGPSDLTCTGILKDWDTAPVASQIQAPTLLVNGQYDEVGDSAVQPFFDKIPRVRWVTLEGASHTAHIEVRQRFMEVVSGFLLS